MLNYNISDEVNNANISESNREALLRFAEAARRSFGNKNVYVVGGYPRNKRLGLRFSDLDVTSALKPADIISLCEENGFHYYKKGVEFGTVEVHIPLGDESVTLEHTTFRSDKYSPGGAHKPREVVFTDNLREDAFRRDFTVNAIYENILTGNVEDPTGGLDDIERKIIRTTSPDPDIVMGDDGVRIMRMVRFASELGFTIDDKTFDSAHRHVSGLSMISKERIRDELTKILLSDVKYDIGGDISPVLKGLLHLKDLDVFAVIIPELEAGRGFGQKPKYHKYDVMTHMLYTSAATPPRIALRLAGLLHDTGKPEAYSKNGGVNMHGHDKIGAGIARRILMGLRYDHDTVERVVRLISIHMYDVAGTARENNIRKRFSQWGHAAVRDLIDFRMADLEGSGIQNTDKESSAKHFRDVYRKMLSDGAPFSYYELNVTGVDIMHELGIDRGPMVGEIKRELLKHCSVHPEDNETLTLLKLSHSVYAQCLKRADNYNSN